MPHVSHHALPRALLLLALSWTLLPTNVRAVESGVAGGPDANVQRHRDAYKRYLEEVADNDFQSAGVHARRAYQMATQDLGPDDLQTGILAYNVGAISLRMQRYRDAVEPLEHALRVYHIHYGEFDEKNVAAERLLGDASWGLDQWPKSERHYVRAIEIIERARGRDDPELGQLLIDLVRVTDALEEYKRCRSYGRRAIHVFAKTSQDDPKALGLLHIRLAGNELRLGDARQAIRHIEAGLEILENRLPQDDPRWGRIYVLASRTYGYVGKSSTARNYKYKARELGFEVPKPEKK